MILRRYNFVLVLGIMDWRIQHGSEPSGTSWAFDQFGRSRSAGHGKGEEDAGALISAVWAHLPTLRAEWAKTEQGREYRRFRRRSPEKQQYLCFVAGRLNELIPRASAPGL